MLRNDCTTLLNVKIDTRHARFIPRGCVVFFPAPGVHCSPARDVMARTYLLRVQAVVGACKHSETIALVFTLRPDLAHTFRLFVKAGMMGWQSCRILA